MIFSLSGVCVPTLNNTYSKERAIRESLFLIYIFLLSRGLLNILAKKYNGCYSRNVKLFKRIEHFGIQERKM